MPRLDRDLEAALLRRLALQFTWLNHGRFEGRLVPPTLELTDDGRLLGQFTSTTRHIRIARRLVLDHPWPVVIEVLAHEMAHQYVHEVLEVRDEPPHGPTFREVCAARRIDAAGCGLPAAVAHGAAEDRILRKVQRLLALAESPNPHEAHAATTAAHRLMRRHNIERIEAERETRYAWRVLGEPALRHERHVKVLSGLLGRHFFVQPIWMPVWIPLRAREGWVLEVSGTSDNLEIAAYVWDYVLQSAERSWRDHKEAHGIPGNRDRRRFLVGVMMGFGEKLADQAEACRQEGLVWKGDPGLRAYVGERYPHLRTRRGSPVQVDGAYQEGKAAGRSIVLRRGVREQATSRGRLLGG